MNIITAMVADITKKNQENWFLFLTLHKYLVERDCEWLKLYIDEGSKELVGKGTLRVDHKKYKIFLSYSPFHKYRYDRIFINDKSIQFQPDNHLYGDDSLCLYHPIIDVPLFQVMPLYKMIPWITEWIIFYEQWKIYGIWLGDEIKH